MIGSQHLGINPANANAVSSQHIYSGAVVSSHFSAGAIQPNAIGFALPIPLGAPAVSNTNGVYTRASVLSASSVNSTVAPGTQPDLARNVIVKFTPASASSSLWSGGTIAVVGSDILGAAVSETFAVTALNTADTNGVSGSKCFASIGTISFSNVSLHTASSSASSDFSFHIGFGGRVGLPFSVQSTNNILSVFKGTSKAAHTGHTGNVPNAGVEIGTWAAASACHAVVYLSR